MRPVCNDAVRRRVIDSKNYYVRNRKIRERERERERAKEEENAAKEYEMTRREPSRKQKCLADWLAFVVSVLLTSSDPAIATVTPRTVSFHKYIYFPRKSILRAKLFRNIFLAKGPFLFVISMQLFFFFFVFSIFKLSKGFEYIDIISFDLVT